MPGHQAPEQVLFGFSPPSSSVKTLLDAVSEIQEFAIAEEVSIMPKEYLTAKGQARLFSIGFVASLNSVVASMFLVPIGMFIFISPGEKTASVKLFALLLMILMPLAMSLLLSSLAKYYNAGLTGCAINRLLAGIFVGGIVISLVTFAAFYIFLLKVVLQYYPLWQAQHTTIPALPHYVTLIPLPSAWIILSLHVLCPLIPCATIFLTRKNSGKTKTAELETRCSIPG